MPTNKPTMAAAIMLRYLWATLLTLGVVLFALLILADQATLRLRGQELSRSLRQVDNVEAYVFSPRCQGSCTPEERSGHMVFNPQGEEISATSTDASDESAAMRCMWPQAATVAAKGELQDVGHLPWIPEQVVWAARALPVAGEGLQIVVTWDRVNAIRAATRVTYGAVTLAVLLAFSVSMLLTLGTARYISGTLQQITDSSARMAQGDFQVRLPEQPTAELDQVATVITSLARSLDATTGDLRAEHERLRRLEAMQRQFVADASHELRAPLTSMRVTLEAWQDGMLQTDEEPRAREHLLQENERLGQLVTRLLDLSRIESGRETLTLAPLSLFEAAIRALSAFREQPGADIALDIDDETPMVLADSDAVHRILLNLLENARKFTPADGTIRLWASSGGERVRLHVSDTGCGIAPDALPRIWDRFARGAHTRASGETGSGLGLAIVKALTEAMHGAVGAESIAADGTTIWVELPRSVTSHS